MKVGDVVKYHFPDPKNLEKTIVLGIITFVSESVIIIDCEDTTKLKVSSKNFSRVELIKSLKKEMVVA